MECCRPLALFYLITYFICVLSHKSLISTIYASFVVLIISALHFEIRTWDSYISTLCMHVIVVCAYAAFFKDRKWYRNTLLRKMLMMVILMASPLFCPLTSMGSGYFSLCVLILVIIYVRLFTKIYHFKDMHTHAEGGKRIDANIGR